VIFPSSLVWTPCKGHGNACGLSEQSSSGFPASPEITVQPHRLILIYGPTLSSHTLCSVKSAHELYMQSSSYVLLPADMKHGGSFSSSLKKARKDQVEFILSEPPHKNSGTPSCLPDVPLTGKHRTLYYASCLCLSCTSGSDCL